MKTETLRQTSGARLWHLLLSLLVLAGLMQALNAQALTINVVGPDGLPITGGFRWLVEEDATKDVDFGRQATPGLDLSVSLHTSYMPVVGKGDSTSPSIELDANKRYYVSVLPNSGYQMGGAQVKPGQASVTVTVNAQPIPTAQISVFAFNDNHPLNNAPDLPQEQGLPGISVLLFEAGGGYGISGGQVLQDAYGNPLGTTYNAAGDVVTMGDGTLKTGPDGTLLIKNLAPAKYGIQMVPPAGAGWHQTSTIEGTKTIDAWVKANEPSYFQEFGPPGHHVFIGFVQDFNNISAASGGTTISGTVVNLHMSRPPDYAFYNGHPIPNCRVGLNEMPAAGGRALYSGPCNADSSFSIPNVPAGDYQLVIWDDYLDVIFATHNITITAGTGPELALQEVPVFFWFSRLESVVFHDANLNGFRDPGEQGMPEQAVNLRFRDGSIYQSFPTDMDGYVPFDEVFPFFNWLVAEVDFARFKATGATIAVDGGGAIDENEYWSYGGKLNPQLQTCTADDVANPDTGCAAVGDPLMNPNDPLTGNLARTETGQVLTQAIQGFLGQSTVIEWGKAVYGPGENGGISGIVQYATTRAENDPRYAAAEPWEPGIPRVQVNLYRDVDNDKNVDDIDDIPGVQYADVDNWPFGWREGTAPKGPEDVDHNGNGSFDMGDAIQVVTTDSWDDSVPTGCQGPSYTAPNGELADCFDGLRNFNQVRPGVFDGGYAFNDIPSGVYIVEAVTPPGYEHVKEEDRNVDFGDEYTPSPLLLPVECVNYDDIDGDGIPGRVVPAVLSLFPDQAVDAGFAGQNRPLCDRKHVVLVDKSNGAANFFMFTEVPVAAHVVGMILDDTANEFDPNAPTFGEKHAPSFVPVSFRDWTGREITRVYSDQFGNFNALVPSTFSMNLPMPSGAAPNMLTACMNSPMKPVLNADGSQALDGNGTPILELDPMFKPQYSQFCYTFQYMPGKTTYLDTPVVPVAAFAGPGQFPLDCELPDVTPVIASVDGHAAGAGAGGASLGGPWIPRPQNSTNTDTQPRLHITSAGMVEVPNPAYDGSGTTTPTIMRDFGFGAAQGDGSVTFNGTALPVVSWTDSTIVVRVPRGVTTGNETTGQLMVRRDLDTATPGSPTQSSATGVTLTIGGNANNVIRVAPGGSIQAAIDGLTGNSGSPLILVPPGTYEELVIMHRPVRLQGWGAFSTKINAVKAPAEKLANWRAKLAELLAANQFSLLPGQEAAFDAADNEPVLFGTEEGPGLLVVGNAANNGTANEFVPNRPARFDGFTITGADHGGGIFVSGYANNLQLSNNRIVSNHGTYGGGIRIGHATLLDEAAASGYTDSQNRNLRIFNNQISQNGSSQGAGGGIALYTGADGYQVRENTVCGNFSLGEGGGIGHLGLSNNGTIAGNTIVFNQTFNQGVGVNGGGVFVGGAAPIVPNVLSAGSGNVDVLANVIKGNQAGAGDGGGIRAQFVNGTDVLASPDDANLWHRLAIHNNIVVDNMAGLAGGGISLQDSARVSIVHNTVANNDSTATAGAAFAANSPNQSTAQPAGIVARAHSQALTNAIGSSAAVQAYKTFSNPALDNNIVWHNRSFYWEMVQGCDATTSATPCFGLQPVINPDGSGAVYDDLAVTGTAGCLTPRNSILTVLGEPGSCGDDGSNSTADPMFAAEYVNGAPGQTIVINETTTGLATAAALDEGGNFIDVRFGPLTLTNAVATPECPVVGACLLGDYHLRDGSPAEGLGAAGTGVNTDVDGDPRPLGGTTPDAGADERL